MAILGFLEYFGVAAFAFSGAIVAVRKRMDIFGIFIMASATAVGGGIIRDITMNLRIPKIFSNYTALIIILAISIITLFLKDFDKLSWVYTIADALGLGLFVADAGAKAIDKGYLFTEFMFFAIVSGIGGGVIRDLLAQRVPVILRKEVYAMAGVVGAVFLWFTYNRIGHGLSINLTVVIIFTIRLISVYKNFNLPIASHTYRIKARDE